MKNNFEDLKTEFILDLDKKKPLPEYPRPLLKRESYLNLNGEWDYAITKSTDLPLHYDGKILVPFPVESELSGVKHLLKSNEYLYYRLKFKFEDNFVKQLVLLHIDAVDQEATVYFNGVVVGNSFNGYVPYTYDVTPFIKRKDENEIIIRVKDALNHKYPYGKQKHHRGGMWYTPCSGIWKTVWMESVYDTYIQNIEITPLKEVINGVHLKMETDGDIKRITVSHKDKILKQYTIDDNELDIVLDNPQLWSPDNPFLYDLRIETENDDIISYFALRKVEIINNKIYLNGKETFCNGLLDQGYFPDGIYTPASYKAYAYDILQMKNLGFNTLRKHIKIEPAMFYYMCDSYGMLVFQDMVNNSHYDFIRDTALPTVFPQIKVGDKLHNRCHNDIFVKAMKEEVKLLKSYPSIILWTIYNEGWGQHNADKMHDLLLELDDTRLIDDTSGWFAQKKNMFESKHIYFREINLDKIKTSKPILISEFGGYSYKVDGHVFNTKKAYGYKQFATQEAFEDGFIELYEKQIIPNKDKLCGTIYTQVSDVEDEINGLLTYDRKILKVDITRVGNTMKKLK